MTSAGVLTEIGSNTVPQAGLPLLGQVRVLANGNRLINTSGAGWVREVTEAGEVVWELETPLGTWLGNTAWADPLLGE